jgi:nitroreductase
MSNFLKAMQFRHACKAFDAQKQIPVEQFEEILESIHLSPSSFGMEPWRILVIRDGRLRKALKASCWNQSQITDASELVIFTTDNDTVRSDSPYVRTMFERRAMPSDMVEKYLSVYGQFIQPLEEDELLLENWTAKQCYIALGNAMTCAAMMEIDSCPIEGFDKEEVEAILDLEYGHSVAVMCAFGYRVNPQGEQKRLELKQIVEYK